MFSKKVLKFWVGFADKTVSRCGKGSNLAVRNSVSRGAFFMKRHLIHAAVAVVVYLSSSVLFTSCNPNRIAPTPGQENPLERNKVGATEKETETVPQNLGATDSRKKLNYGQGVYLVLKKDSGKTYNNLDNLRLSLVENGIEKESVPAVSGQAYAQVYRKKSSPGNAGSMQPLPEAKYNLGAGVAVYDDGLAPVFYSIYPDPLPRGEFGIHLDENRNEGKPGTAGCVGIPDKTKLDTVKRWMNLSKPKVLFVDWNLGTFATSSSPPSLGLLSGVGQWLGLKEDSEVKEVVEPFDIQSEFSGLTRFNRNQGEILN
jgi:hypothetical protein